jgi:hypothetical protein
VRLRLSGLANAARDDKSSCNQALRTPQKEVVANLNKSFTLLLPKRTTLLARSYLFFAERLRWSGANHPHPHAPSALAPGHPLFVRRGPSPSRRVPLGESEHREGGGVSRRLVFYILPDRDDLRLDLIGSGAMMGWAATAAGIERCRRSGWSVHFEGELTAGGW